MKHLLNGVAVVAALAIAAPVWAQTAAPMTPSSRAPAAPAASAPAPAAPMATKARHKRVVHRKTRRGMARRGTPDSMANQLNAPAPTQGIPGGNQPSASSHPPAYR